jgi:hypothetical protein
MTAERPNVDVPDPVSHLHAIRKALGKIDHQWGHLRYEELGGDYLHRSGLPETLIDATTELYQTARTMARDLQDRFASVTNPLFFPEISDFTQYFDNHVPQQIVELEEVVAQCTAALAAIPANVDWDTVFERAKAHSGDRALSPWHLRTTINDMVGLGRRQLALLMAAEKDVAALRDDYGQRVPVENAQKPVPQPRNAFYKHGASWVLVFNGETATPLKDSLGLHDYAYLLAHPSESVSALDLVRNTAGHAPDVRQREDFAMVEGTGMRDDFNTTLDWKAIAVVKTRIREIDAELSRADADNDPGPVPRLRVEREKLQDYLLQGVRRERFPDERNKARSVVWHRMKRALAEIARHLPDLAEHLESAVDTRGGYTYRPRDIDWVLSPPTTPRNTA